MKLVAHIIKGLMTVVLHLKTYFTILEKLEKYKLNGFLAF